jgi:hypothetical protein
MRATESAARAALWQAYCHHGLNRFRPTDRHPEQTVYRRAVELGWLWQPADGWYAITPDGLKAIEPFRRAERLPDRPAEKRGTMR